jgi:hypothetical protein
VNTDPSLLVIVVIVASDEGIVKLSPDSETTVVPPGFVVVKATTLVVDDAVDVELVGLKVITDPSLFLIVVGVDTALGIVKPSPELDINVSLAELVVVRAAGVLEFNELEGWSDMVEGWKVTAEPSGSVTLVVAEMPVGSVVAPSLSEITVCPRELVVVTKPEIVGEPVDKLDKFVVSDCELSEVETPGPVNVKLEVPTLAGLLDNDPV